MITLQLQGRLGNQLFEIFTLVSAAIETQQSFAVYVKPRENERSYWDTVFKKLYPKHVFSTYLKPKMTVLDNCLPFLHLIKHCKGTVGQIHGYFQRLCFIEKYFDTVSSFLEFPELRSGVFEKLKLKMPIITNWKKTVSMHFRFGDYLEKQEYHPVLPYQYFFDSLNKILYDHPEVKQVIYFCDVNDLEMVNPIILDLSLTFTHLEFYKIVDGLEDWEELFAMSCCQHNIIANSTFSWWGAYLKTNVKSKTVCYPSIWFGPKVEEFATRKNMFPDYWTKIEIN